MSGATLRLNEYLPPAGEILRCRVTTEGGDEVTIRTFDTGAEMKAWMIQDARKRGGLLHWLLNFISDPERPVWRYSDAQTTLYRVTVVPESLRLPTGRPFVPAMSTCAGWDEKGCTRDEECACGGSGIVWNEDWTEDDAPPMPSLFGVQEANP